jgi:poly(ADP-ribose) glycohydrolase ARH3
MDLRDRARGAMIGTLIGDALGRPFEGTPLGDLARLSRALDHRVRTPAAWSHTDDGEMTLNLAQSIVEAGGVVEDRVLERLTEGADLARGYGKGTRAAFRVWRAQRSSRESAYAAWPEGSRGNGASVRVAPVAIFHVEATHDELCAAARRSALPTHAHLEAIAGAVVTALAIQTALRGGDRSAVLAAAREGASTDFAGRLDHVTELRGASHDTAARSIGHGVEAIESVPAALWAFAESTCFADTVAGAVRLGGDTDSIGAIAGAVAGACYGASNVPREWRAALEPGASTLAESLADRLLAGRTG